MIIMRILALSTPGRQAEAASLFGLIGGVCWNNQGQFIRCGT